MYESYMADSPYKILYSDAVDDQFHIGRSACRHVIRL